MEAATTEMVKLSFKEINILGHALGINVYNNCKTKKKRDKILPKKYYRNYFSASVNHDDFPTLSDLQNKGYMHSWSQFNNTYFGVTEEGKNVFETEYARLISENYQP